MAKRDHVAPHLLAGRADRPNLFHAIVERLGGFRPNRPLGGQPHVRHHDIGPCPRHRPPLLDRERIRRCQHVHLVCGGDHFHLERIAHARLFQIRPKHAVDQAHGGEILDACKPQVAQFPQKMIAQHKGIRPIHPGQHGRVRHSGEDFTRHFFHDLVGIAIRQHAGQGPAPGHAIPPGIVDHDQVDAARFLALRRNPRTRPAADNRHAHRDFFAQPRQNRCPALRCHHALRIS